MAFNKKNWQILLLLGLTLSVFVACSSRDDDKGKDKTLELRAVWVQAKSIKTPEAVQEVLARAQAGHFNAIFVNVFVYGYAYFDSQLVNKQPDLALNYDPLAYLIEQAKQRKVVVHAWLVAGPVGDPSPVLAQHPEWAMTGPDGQQTSWLNYTRPDVRQFIADVAVELVKNYELAGIHFDYTRYPGVKWGFDSYSAEQANKESNLDLEVLRYADLPAYGQFEGNPLAGVNTAEVLATFGNGQPAVLLNKYGTGQVIVLNWEADEREVAASSEIFKRSLNYLSGNKGSDIYLLRSETNAVEYGYSDFDSVFIWLEDLGWLPREVQEDKLNTLNSDTVLVIPSVYLINESVAADLANFVEHGGGLIFIDGPSRSIRDTNIQAITGMYSWGGHFKNTDLLIAATEHPLIPNSNRGADLKQYQNLDVQWKAFRRHGINKLLSKVYQEVKEESPDTMVTITVDADHEAIAERFLLDWRSWLEGDYIDLIIPRAYIQEGDTLESRIAPWYPVIADFDKVTFGLKVYADQESNETKSSTQIISEIDLARLSGSRGVVLFDLEGTNEEMLKALADGPFFEP